MALLQLRKSDAGSRNQLTFIDCMVIFLVLVIGTNMPSFPGSPWKPRPLPIEYSSRTGIPKSNCDDGCEQAIDRMRLAATESFRHSGVGVRLKSPCWANNSYKGIFLSRGCCLPRFLPPGFKSPLNGQVEACRCTLKASCFPIQARTS